MDWTAWHDRTVGTDEEPMYLEIEHDDGTIEAITVERR